MLKNLVKMYEDGVLSGYQLMMDCLHMLDPHSPGLVLDHLPDEVLEEMLQYAGRFDPHRRRPESPVPPTEDQVKSAERWIQSHRLAPARVSKTDSSKE
jgi:hypothetical protein